MANNDVLDFNDIPDFDMTYTEQFEKLERFYKCKLEYIRFHYIYINNNTIDSIFEEERNINNNTISDKELVYLIGKNKKRNNKSYKYDSMFFYNMDLDSEETLYDNMPSIELREIKTLESIKFNDSIPYFNDLNSIYIIFIQMNDKPNHNNIINNNTRKIRIR
tara:strand:- start:7624 stop:8112 length:489 start_codon:yes stop_codon:yes gene_type:complete